MRGARGKGSAHFDLDPFCLVISNFLVLGVGIEITLQFVFFDFGVALVVRHED